MMKYDCDLCNKSYKHRQSLYKHIKQKHSVKKSSEMGNVLTTGQPKVSHPVSQKSASGQPKVSHVSLIDNCGFIGPNELEIREYICDYCDKVYKHKQSKHKHLKVCKKKIEYEKELEELKEDNKELKKNNKELELYNRKLKKNNTQLVKNTNINNNHQSINNSNNTNNIQNNNININIVPLGMEDLQNVISNEEQVEILNRQYNSLKHLISKIYNEDKYSKYRSD
jgi:hypothetical protein